MTVAFYSRTLVPCLPSSPTPSSSSAPACIPSYVYRVHHASSQAKYSFTTGFRAKNQTTILDGKSILDRFGLAHLHHQTNISSPLISVYDSRVRAEQVAYYYFAPKYPGEDIFIVTIDTQHLARGPVFRAADILKDSSPSASSAEDWLHEGEYLLMYKIPMQAIRTDEKVWRERGNVDQSALAPIGTRL
ncbi:hypothetical protein ACEQ8H_005876 [Pleosporales sp. CAS-2024a]